MSQNYPMGEHECQYRQDDRGWSALMAEWKLPMLHFLGSFAIALGLTCLVDGRVFPVGEGILSTSHDHGETHVLLTQSAVTTILSSSLVFHRLAGDSWLTIAGWRMAFTILELNEASLGEVGRMIHYRCPPFRAHKRNPTKKDSKVLSVMWTIYLLSVPALFTSPILTGAVNWIPTELYEMSDTTVKIPEPGPGTWWDWHNIFENNRLYEVFGAIGFAAAATSLDFYSNETVAYRRGLPTLPTGKSDEYKHPTLSTSQSWTYSPLPDLESIKGKSLTNERAGPKGTIVCVEEQALEQHLLTS